MSENAYAIWFCGYCHNQLTSEDPSFYCSACDCHFDQDGYEETEDD